MTMIFSHCGDFCCLGECSQNDFVLNESIYVVNLSLPASEASAHSAIVVLFHLSSHRALKCHVQDSRKKKLEHSESKQSFHSQSHT